MLCGSLHFLIHFTGQNKNAATVYRVYLLCFFSLKDFSLKKREKERKKESNIPFIVEECLVRKFHPRRRVCHDSLRNFWNFASVLGIKDGAVFCVL